MRKSLVCILAAGCYVSSLATDARVVSMGKHDAFFMDEVSIYRNPANISVYPNMVYGSFGLYMPDTTVDDEHAALDRTNKDPADPFFGGIISYSLNQGTDNGTQYPMLSLGAFFNRRDEMLNYLTKGTKEYIGGPNDSLPTPVGKVDVLLGYVLKNGTMLGASGYFALQKIQNDGNDIEASLYKGNVGINCPVAKSIDLEVSVGGGAITAIASNLDTAKSNKSKTNTIASQDYFLRIEGRLFAALTAINGDFVPHVRVDMLNLDKKDISKIDLAAGLGLNVNIDKGFFWLGLEFLYGQKDTKKDSSSSLEHIGARVSFGIERNILTDWLVIRVGGQKELIKETDGPYKGKFIENDPSDASDGDLVGLGFGVNIDNRLRIDVVAAEDVVYTFTNLVSGPQHHLFNRVSATYSF